MTLMRHQREGVDFAIEHDKAIIAHGMRLGKTRTALTYLNELNLFPALVVAPATLRWVWAEQAEQWFPGMRVQVLEHLTDRFKAGADIHVCSYEYITKTKQIPVSRLRALVVDESHYLKTLDTKRTQRVWSLADRIERAVLLSGTIMPSRPVELYTSLRMVGALNMDYGNYTKRYCGAYPTPWGYDVSGATNVDELAQVLQPYMHHRTKEMVRDDLPPKSRQIIALDLPLDRREKQFELAALERERPDIAFEGLTDLLVFIGTIKAPSIIEFVEGLLAQTQKVVVFFQYHSTADLLEAGLSKYGLVRFDGKTSDAQRKRHVMRFQNDRGTRVFLGQIKAAGVGIPLWAADTTVFAEASWVPGDLEQAEARVDIIHGTPQPTMHYYMTQHGSVDEYMLRRTLEKNQIIQRVIDPAADIL